jgi:hypothetical protein
MTMTDDPSKGEQGRPPGDPWAPPPEQPGPYGAPPSGQPGYPPPYATPQQPYGGQQPPYGAPQPPYGYGYPQSRGTNGFAIASIVCAFLCTPLGLIFGFIARSQIKRTGEGGDGLALAGIIISAVFLVISIAVWSMVAASATSGPTMWNGI